ncbi:MAG TPA: Glu-tRNA(Gln) amidotransferase subunit GatE, partial [Thermoplasmatales archaeon]|nr:Glu-tRNA(Gln) amidotransferase subunit GatE [Thermoplasmatales archaeon]
MDYKAIGFKAGLEIHQQLDTKKLFCNCPSKITDDADYSFHRFLRPTQSELGEVDKAALAEAKKHRHFLYTASHHFTCLVEADEEPPHALNNEALDVALTMSILVNAKPVDEVHVMRKIVIDGSNTSGFQRTALIALDGRVKDVGIETIALEEDAARKLEEKKGFVNYGLDRLGIPLIEVATAADITTPHHARETAEYIGSLLQATGKCKRGLGTVRQDLNISIAQGARVEIKGIQSLSAIEKVAEKEVLRQLDLIEIKETLHERGVKESDIKNAPSMDFTDELKNCESRIVQNTLSKGGKAVVLKLPGFAGLLKKESSRLGREFAVHAKLASGIGGILHSDELPGYGLKEKEIMRIKEKLKLKEDDAFALFLGKEKMVKEAVQAVRERAETALHGVTEEVRRTLPDHSTEYMRPLPGAARMYPETDVPPVQITKDRLARIRKNLPEKPEEREERLRETYGLNRDQTKQLIQSGYVKDFEWFAQRFPKLTKTILRTFLNTFPELENEGVIIEDINNTLLEEIFLLLQKGVFAKEAVPELLGYLAQHKDADINEAIKECGLRVVS